MARKCNAERFTLFSSCGRSLFFIVRRGFRVIPPPLRPRIFRWCESNRLLVRSEKQRQPKRVRNPTGGPRRAPEAEGGALWREAVGGAKGRVFNGGTQVSGSNQALRNQYGGPIQLDAPANQNRRGAMLPVCYPLLMIHPWVKLRGFSQGGASRLGKQKIK